MATEYIEYPELIYVDYTDEKQVLRELPTGMIREFSCISTLGEAEFFLIDKSFGEVSIGKTTAGYLTMPSPEIASIPQNSEVLENYKKHNFPIGFFYDSGEISVKLTPKYGAIPMKMPILMIYGAFLTPQ
jgi:hypothetical protein